VYHGAGFGDTWRSTPWTRYYDIGTQEGWDQLNDMFEAIGVNRKVIVPLQAVPFAQVPGILCSRYPDVAAKRKSVDDDRGRSEKNLHVALCELTGGVPYQDHCSQEMLLDLIRRFAPRCRDYGKRSARMLVRQEICAMLYANRDHKDLAPVRNLVDDCWAREFIHYGHFYKVVPPDFEAILRQYLPAAPDGTKCPGGVWIR